MNKITAVIVLWIASVASAVEYQVTFESTWSETSHPGAYPGAAAHFSAPVGGTHSADISFWQVGGSASAALEDTAENGGTTQLRDAVDAAVMTGNAGQSFVGSFMGNLPNQQVLNLEFSDAYPLLTFTSMIGPSPDWFVGVAGLNLKEDDRWLDELSVELRPYDAGTESGMDFAMLNPATVPQQTIRLLDNDVSSVFVGLPPLARLTLERVLVCDFNGDGVCNASDLSTQDGLYSVGDLEAGVAVGGDVATIFDLTGDGRVDTSDLDQWLADAATTNGFAAPYLKGDTNLNDHVGFGDFTQFSRNFGSGREWTEGNYRGSGVATFNDFLLLSRNFGESIPRAAQPLAAAHFAAVPEPIAAWQFAVGCLVLCCYRRDRRVS